MAIVYRTVFEDTRSDLMNAARLAWENWLSEKRGAPVALPEPEGESRLDHWTLRRFRVSSNGTEAERLVLLEEQPSSQWTTTLTTLVGESSQTVWLDLDTVRDEVFGQPPDVRSPVVVRSLIANRTSRMGTAWLFEQPVPAATSGDGELLAETLHDQARGAPLVVFSRKYGEDDQRLMARAERAASRLAGVANVWLFRDSRAEQQFNAVVDDSLRVFGGAVRTYLPGLNKEQPNQWRHKFLRWDVVKKHPDVAGRIVGRALMERAVALRPPSLYTQNARALSALRGVPGGDAEDWMKAWDQEDTAHQETRQRLTSALDDRDLLQLQADEQEGEIAQLNARVQLLERALREQGQDPWTVTQSATSSAVPDSVDSCAEALKEARVHLSGVVLPDHLDATAAALDSYQEASTFAGKAWRSFLALEAYVQAKQLGAAGDFGTLLKQNRLSPAIPTGWWTPKESETTANNPRFRDARTLPVDQNAVAEGQVYMEAHLKLVPGGSPAPRIHVYDDTAGPTGKIHVGHFGDHLENARTN